MAVQNVGGLPLSKPESDAEWFARYQRQRVRSHASTQAIKRALYLRSGGHCYVCDFSVLDVITTHHIKPVSKNGESWQENLVRLCPNCHALVHWCSKRTYATVKQRQGSLTPFGVPNDQAFKVALLSTEEVIIDDEGAIFPRTKLVPEDTLTHTELYEIFNWWPTQKTVGEN